MKKSKRLTTDECHPLCKCNGQMVEIQRFGGSIQFKCKKCGRMLNEKFKSMHEENICIWCNKEKYFPKGNNE